MGLVVVSLPMTVVFIGMIVGPKSGPSALTLAGALGTLGVVLAVAVLAAVSVASYRQTRNPDRSVPVDLDGRMKLWGVSALGLYLLCWVGILAWMVA